MDSGNGALLRFRGQKWEKWPKSTRTEGSLWYQREQTLHPSLVSTNNPPRTWDFQQSAAASEQISLLLSAEIEFSWLHSSSRLTMFVPPTILIRSWQIKDPVKNHQAENAVGRGEERRGTDERRGDLETDETAWWYMTEGRRRVESTL